MKVKRIDYAGKADVYNMEVDETHDFAVNGGVIVHNCFDSCRYICAANPIKSAIPPQAKIAQYSPLESGRRYEYVED